MINRSRLLSALNFLALNDTKISTTTKKVIKISFASDKGKLYSLYCSYSYFYLFLYVHACVCDDEKVTKIIL